ncbi:MAG TPA: mechanosensitive ion channel domain-containing protein, partial [Planctomycetota bacterium]|nr:mechanosensitive ion channel domain-containing protein [Planctomycetota bacterium]
GDLRGKPGVWRIPGGMTPLAILVQDAAAAPAPAAPPADGAGPAAALDVASLDVPALLQKLADWAVSFAPSLVGALLTLIVGVWLAKLVSRGLRGLMARGKVDPSLIQFLSGLAYYGLLALVLIAVAGKLGVETTSFVALLGAVGLAVGFALQGSLGNLASGVLILLFRPFRIGDLIEAGGQSGVVQEIGVFATVLATVDNRKVIVPNSAITGGSIVNATAHPTRRVDLHFVIAADEDLRKTRDVILRVATTEAGVLKDPAPQVIFLALPDGLNVKLMAWVSTPEYLAMQALLFEQVKLAFAAGGIRVAVPVREVRMVGQAAK